MAEFARYTVGKLAGTEPAAQPCFDPVGSLEVATTEERWADLHRKHGWASFWGVEGARLVNAAECSRLHPLLEQERLRGGLYVASDGLANAVQAGEELARRATSRGARFLGGQTVLDVLSRSGRVTGVVSGSGTVPAAWSSCALASGERKSADGRPHRAAAAHGAPVRPHRVGTAPG